MPTDGDYYDQLAAYDEPARADGWRHPLEQLYRFEVALDAIPDAPLELLDIGCGSGALASFLRVRRPEIDYTGVDVRSAALRHARRREPTAKFAHLDYLEDDLPRCDVAVAIGALVDGSEMSTRSRLERLQRLIRGVSDAGKTAGCVIVLKQEVVDERASLGVEAALGGATRSELSEIADGLGRPYSIDDSVSNTDRALFFATPGANLSLRDARQRLRSVLEGEVGRDASPERRAWMACEVGLPVMARQHLEESGPTPLAEIVRERLAAMND